jgi:KAP family P-loop domain
MILSDNETKVDLLNNEAIAKTIVTLLRERPEHPITIGVHGDWGAGKSSVLEMIEATLDPDDKVLCLKFNGWRFQGFEDAKIALIEGIVTGLIEERSLLTNAAEATKKILRRIDLLKAAKKIGGLALTGYAAMHGAGAHALAIPGILTTLEGWAADPSKIKADDIKGMISGASGLLKPGESPNVPEEIAAFRKEFDELLDKAGIEQLVVLIDDLDRCLPDTAIETLEAIRLFVFTSRTAFVVAADEAMIEYSVRKHFPDLPDTTGPQTYARNYLEKLIQVPFRIPALGETETRIYVTLLLIGAELEENDPDFAKLIAAAREQLKRPWTAANLDQAKIRATLGDKAASARDALILSEQIGPILASGTKGNPRQIKRFLNTLLLRRASAEARGFGEDVKLPVLAKLMLAERFLSRQFDQLATCAASAADGICRDLITLEEAVRATTKSASEPARVKPARAKATGDPEPVPTEEAKPPSVQLSEWTSSEFVRAWAKIEPSIGTADLRPYLFVAKDRKDYFGATTILGQIASIAEKLLGPKFSVQSSESELRQLALPEAAQVLDLLRARIVASDTFDTEPAGVAGIAVLVRAQPALQPQLLDFLEGLPSSRLGSWVCSGWEGVIKDAEHNRRFDQQLESWKTDGATMLKATAAGVLKTRQQGGRR